MTETISAASALQTAIYRRLAGFTPLTALTGASGIVDRRLSAPTSPLVVIAAIDSTDRSTSTEAGEEHTVTLEVWSQAAGHRQAQAIEAAVRAALHDAALTLAGHHLVLLLHRDTRLRRDGSSRFHRAEMRFRAVTEPAA
jgi:Tfp pilus assembly protein PilX